MLDSIEYTFDSKRGEWSMGESRIELWIDDAADNEFASISW